MTKLPANVVEALERYSRSLQWSDEEKLKEWHPALGREDLNGRKALEGALTRGLRLRVDKRLDSADHAIYRWLLGRFDEAGSGPALVEDDGGIYSVCEFCHLVTHGKRFKTVCRSHHGREKPAENLIYITVPCPGPASDRPRPPECPGEMYASARRERRGEEAGVYPYFGQFEARCPQCKKADENEDKARRARERRTRRRVDPPAGP